MSQILYLITYFIHLYTFKFQRKIYSENSRIVLAATVTISKKDDIATRSIFKSEALKVLHFKYIKKSV